MRYTNKHNLPQALVDLVKDSAFGYKDKCFSVTTLLNPTQLTILTKTHFDDIELDVADQVNQILGTATHSLLEKFDKTGCAELYLKEHIKDGYFLTGKCDLYEESTHTLIDYKTATCWKIIYKDFEDWRKQGLMYAWLLGKQGKYVDTIKFHAILKDWTARELRQAEFKGDFYPPCQVYTYEHKVSASDLLEIEDFISKKFDELIRADITGELPMCSNEDTWYTGDKYAVYGKKGDARAKRVLDTESEANDYNANQLGGKGYVEHRTGEHRRCQDYCDVASFCKQFNKEVL